MSTVLLESQQDPPSAVSADVSTLSVTWFSVEMLVFCFFCGGGLASHHIQDQNHHQMVPSDLLDHNSARVEDQSALPGSTVWL